MQSKKLTAVAVLVAAITGVVAGTSHAESAPDASIDYHAEVIDDERSRITTDAGSLVVEDDVFKIKAVDGTTVAGAELKFRIDDFELPIAADIVGNTATLMPVLDAGRAVYKPVALPYEDKAPWKNEYDREQAAWSRLTSTIAMGATIGTLVGGLAGAGIGCVAGAAAGLVATGILAALFGAGPLLGCAVGAAGVGFLGTLIGQIVVTAPVAIAAAIQYFSTINQPSPATK
ncbi:hypothetical protein [Nocardia araoensis]|uniref:hypothetical protein n=1 Tax=Nocardia araoensis TaxID=228600 RepID=UPI00030FA564|nr:hypothetical protein [Nocardia araoensis]